MVINTKINSSCYKRCVPGKSEISVVGRKKHVFQVNWLIDYVMYNNYFFLHDIAFYS